MASGEFVLEPRGPFTLASAARFIAGWPPADSRAAGDGEVRLAFLADDFSGDAGVVLRQGPEGTVRGTITGGSAADPERVAAQAARVVSLDHDGTGYAALGERDPVIDRLQRASGYLRPVLFHSPYEAACWGIVSARLRQPQAARVRDELSARHGGRLTVASVEMLTFPAPAALLAVEEISGLTAEKVARLHGIARAALEGRLDRAALLAAEPDAALAGLRELRGIGPFWAELIYLRAVGPTDVLTLHEPRVRATAAEHYGAPEVVDDEGAFAALAERWRPFRTWATVLLRAAG
jgi:DNA-3-methyladenine glycosylase II